MQDAGHKLHLNVAEQLPELVGSCTNKLSGTNEEGAELNRQFLFGSINKILTLGMRRQKSMTNDFHNIHK